MIKILAIDDNIDNLISLKAILMDFFSDIVVFTSQNGQHGIELAIAENPDVILLDVVMPNMDGFEVCRRLKSDKRVQEIPVVFITALKGDKANRIKALEIGAEGFLSKPIDESELVAQVKAMIKIKAAYNELCHEKEHLTALVEERTYALKQSNEMLFKLTEQVPGVVYQYRLYEDGHSCFPYSSPGMIDIYGVTPEEVREDATPVFGRLHPDDFDFIVSSIQESARTMELYHSEFRVILPEVGVQWRLCDAKPERMPDGSTLWYGIISDITERKKVENSLMESEKKYRELFESNSDSIAIFQIHPDQRTLQFVDCNENNALLLGYSKEEILHFQPKDVEIPVSDEVLQWRQGELLKNGQIGFETQLKHKSGHLIDVEIKAVMINYKNQPGIMNISRDITKGRQIEERIRLLAYSLESISECVSITDNNDQIIYINKSFLNTYGYSSEELIGQHTRILRSSDMAFEHVRDILPITFEGGWRGEIMNRKKDGTLFPILLSTSIIKDEKDNPIALIGVATDISDMRKARAELIAAKEQAVESNQLKTAFLNNMSHEIRTPMNHIMGFSSLMSEAKGVEKDQYAEIILSSSNQLLSLIENVILLSRLQSEKTEINKHAFDPQELIESLSNLFKSDCKDNKVTLEVKKPAENIHQSIYTDQEKIKQILIILTANAVKYTKNGFIEIGYEIIEEKINFHIKDSGIGIPLKEHKKIFDSFYRGEQAISLAIGGTGLGLSIAKELVKSLDGSIWLESQPGNGSIFYFSIPVVLTKELAFEEKLVHNTHYKLKDMSILIADDEQINFLYLEILLKSSVKKIDHAHNGKEAVEMVSKKMYDLIFMDLKMPEMNGYDATKKIKISHPNIPIIAQTAYASIEEKEKAVLAGCDDFIAKPIKKNILLEVIEKYS
ncbi:MAG: response regulator [Prolixibacteraceae bacterium]